jgi:hypothetical protein
LLGLSGVATAVILDAVLFGWKQTPAPAGARPWVTPWIDPGHGRVGLGYAAEF